MLLLVALYLLWRVKQVLLLIFTAIVLTIPLNRLVARWRRLGIQRRVAILLSTVTLVTLFLLVTGIVVPPFIEQLRRLAEFVILGLGQFQNALVQLQSRLPESLQLPDAPLGSFTEQVQPLARWTFDHVFALFSDLLTVLLNLLLLLVLTIMLLSNPAAYRRSLIQLIPSFYRHRIDAVLSQCEGKLVDWMRATVWQMVIVFGATALGLGILQVPLVLTNAALAGLLEVIPNLGVVLSLIPPLAAAWFSAPWKAVAVIVLYLLVQWLKHKVLVRWGKPQEKVLLPAVVLLAQLSLAFFCGAWGLILTVPIVLVGQIFTREIFINDLLHRWHLSEPQQRKKLGIKR